VLRPFGTGVRDSQIVFAFLKHLLAERKRRNKKEIMINYKIYVVDNKQSKLKRYEINVQ
jgi:hypothetical protein